MRRNCERTDHSVAYQFISLLLACCLSFIPHKELDHFQITGFSDGESVRTGSRCGLCVQYILKKNLYFWEWLYKLKPVERIELYDYPLCAVCRDTDAVPDASTGTSRLFPLQTVPEFTVRCCSVELWWCAQAGTSLPKSRFLFEQLLSDMRD